MSDDEPDEETPWEVSEYQPVRLPGLGDMLLTWEAAGLAIVVIVGLWHWAS